MNVNRPARAIHYPPTWKDFGPGSRGGGRLPTPRSAGSMR